MVSKLSSGSRPPRQLRDFQGTHIVIWHFICTRVPNFGAKLCT